MWTLFQVAVLLGLWSCSFAKENVISEEMVNQINILNVGWQAKVYSRFNKMSIEEASNMLGGKIGWPENKPPPIHVMKARSDIPDTFDSREQWPGSIHPIRNQGSCGSCWAFGASETLSDRFAIATQNRVNVILSAQQLVDCNTDNTGCKGGWPINAWNYMKDVGLLTEQCYGPYYAKQYTCRLTANTTKCPYEPTVPATFYRTKNAYRVPPKNVVAMQTEIMTYGPVEADFTVYQDFFAYRSGVYMHTTGKQVGGHAIKVLGWGTENGVDYWLCANSWGNTWGLSGYFKIRRGTDECGIEEDMTAGQPLVQ